MAKKQKEYTTDKGRPSIWNQQSDAHVSSDKESDRIYAQMTGEGLISSESSKKGNNRRV